MAERTKSIVFVSLEPTQVGKSSPELPLHITVVPPFEHPRAATDAVLHTVGSKLAHAEPFTVVGGELDFFGPNNEHVVRRIVGNQALTAIHLQLFDGLDTVRGVELDRTYAGSAELYNPHSTYKSSQGFAEGQTHTVTELYVAQKRKYINARGMHKAWQVISKYDLDGES